MANNKLCLRKNELVEDADWLAFSLEVFLRAFNLLKDFSEFFKSHTGKCCGIDHDKMQLFGALNVVIIVMKSKRPGLFRDICGCARQEEHEDIPDCIIQQVNEVFNNLENGCVIDNIVRDVKDLLGIIKNNPTFAMSTKLKMLSYLLQEIMNKLISCCTTSADQLTRTQAKWILRLVNNCIRDWGMRNSQCKFCDRPTSKVAQRLGTYCCRSLKFYYDILEEWALQESISSAYRQKSCLARSVGGSVCRRAFSAFKDVRGADDEFDVEGKWAADIPQEVFDVDRAVKHRDTDRGPIPPFRKVAGSSLRETEAESSGGAASRPADKLDGIGGRDLTMATRRRIDEEVGKEARSRRNIDKDPGSPIVADGREERDDVPRGLNGLAPGDPDTDEGGTAVRKMRKIKSDKTPPAPDRKRDRPLRSDTEGNGPDRSARDRSRTMKSRGEADRSERDEEAARGKKKSKGNQTLESAHEQPGRSKAKKLRPIGDKEYDEENDDDDEGSPRSKRKSKRPQNLEAIDEGRDDDNDDDEGSPRSKRKSKRPQNLKAIDEGRDDDDDEGSARSKRKSKRPQNLEAIDEGRDRHIRGKQLSGRRSEMEDTDGEERTSRRGAKKMAKGKKKMEDKEDVGESIGAQERRKKKTDALDNRERQRVHGFDEDGSVPKRDGKRRARWSDDEADSGVMKRAGKTRGASAGDKSTPNSESQSKKDTREANTKGRKGGDSGKADDDYSKINGSRYRQGTTKASDLHGTVSLFPKVPITSIGNSASLSGLLIPQRPTEARYQIIINPVLLGALGMFERGHLIEYQLSNESFVKHGWTMMPIPKIMKKVVHYQAKPAKPRMNWFERRKCEGKIYHNDGVTTFVKFHPDGSADVFYPNGNVAIEFCKPGNKKYGMYTVFSPGGKDCVGVERKSQIVGVFDTVGNGAVFDEDGATRLSYNQIGGIWRDNPAGLPLVWKWDVDEKNLPMKTVYLEKSTIRIERFLPEQQVQTIKSSGSGKAPSSPASSRNKEKKVVEQKPVVEVHDTEEEVTSGFQDENCKDNLQLKIICLKLTDHISMRISNRRQICLQYFAAGKNIRIELGTVLNFKKEVATHFVDTSLNNALLKCKFDDLLASSVEPEDSLHSVVERLREVKKSAKQRKFMIRKYKPHLPLQEASKKKRCL